MKTETESKPEMICGYEVHPAASLFPLMPPDELKALSKDIKKNGLIYPVIMCDNKILDGRNRLLACEMAGVGVHFRDFSTYKSEHSPVEWVAATNMKRRDLKPGQKAAIAVKLEKMFAAEAKERQRGKAKVPEGEKGQARDKAAKIAKVSPRYVQDAKKIEAKSPKLFAEVASGKKTIPEAMRGLWEMNKIPAPAEHHPDDNDSDKLFQLKFAWRNARKGDRATFWKWAVASGGKGDWDTFVQTCKLIQAQIETLPHHTCMTKQRGVDYVTRLLQDFVNLGSLECNVPGCKNLAKNMPALCPEHRKALKAIEKRKDPKPAKTTR